MAIPDPLPPPPNTRPAGETSQPQKGKHGSKGHPGSSTSMETPEIAYDMCPRQHQAGRRYLPLYELGRVRCEPLREVVIGHGLLGDVTVPHEEAVQGPEVMQEAQQAAEDQGGQEEEAEEDAGGHLDEPQPPEHGQGQQRDGDDLQGEEDQQP